MNVTNILLIPLLPLLSFILMGLFGKSVFKEKSGLAGTLLMGASFIFSCITAYNYFFITGKGSGSIYRQSIPFKMTWLQFGNGLSIDMGVLLDPISVMMLIVVTLVSLMVHIYSLSYMKGEERFPAYYAFLGLFSFSMLGLVLASNIFQMYIFWELVGVSSFLLIGFYYSKSSALSAAKKAAQSLSKDDSKLLALESDVSAAASEIKAIQKVLEHFGQLDVLIANAGVGHFASIENLTTEQWKETLDKLIAGELVGVAAYPLIVGDPFFYRKQVPLVVSEWGGFGFVNYGGPENNNDKVELIKQYKLELRNRAIAGDVYTQATNIEEEKNGLIDTETGRLFVPPAILRSIPKK